MKSLLFATGNETKSKRFSKQLLEYNIEIVTLKDIGLRLNVEEDGSDAIENALIKARAYYEATGLTTIAMDDSLYFSNIDDNLQPGVYVRRIDGKVLDDEQMINYYTSLADKYGNDGKIDAKWVYGLALINGGKEYTFTWNKDDFYIMNVASKKNNPGYPLNSISFSKRLNKYFVDITDDEKKLIDENEEDVINFIVNNLIEG